MLRKNSGYKRETFKKRKNRIFLMKDKANSRKYVENGNLKMLFIRRIKT